MTILGPENPKRPIDRVPNPRRAQPHLYSRADFSGAIPCEKTEKRGVPGFTIIAIDNIASQTAQWSLKAGEFTKYLYLRELSVEVTEATAEPIQKWAKQFLGIAGEDSSGVTDLFPQKYRCSRYSFGYPACPNLEDQAKIFKLLEPETIGVRLTEGFHQEPQQSANATLVLHPQAKYFVPQGSRVTAFLHRQGGFW